MSQDADSPEIDILIEPKSEFLESENISEERFGEALDLLFEKANNEELPTEDEERPLEDWSITIGEKSYRLGDLADIEILELPEGYDDDEEEIE